MPKSNITTLHIAVLSFLALGATLSTGHWAVAVVPTLVSAYVLVVYRSCPVRTEVVFVCLGIALLASLYKLTPLMFRDFQPGSETAPQTPIVTEPLYVLACQVVRTGSAVKVGHFCFGAVLVVPFAFAIISLWPVLGEMMAKDERNANVDDVLR